jgi:hypothetical protein
MTHPVTPPPELVQQWATSSPLNFDDENWGYELFIAHHAAQWGADQELEACCEWVEKTISSWAPNTLNEQLRTARRPKPPSLKEQALALLDPSNTYGSVTRDEEYRISVTKAEIIRRALEALSDD